MILHANYQGSMPCEFKQEDFFMFLYLSLCKHVTPGEHIFGHIYRKLTTENLVNMGF